MRHKLSGKRSRLSAAILAAVVVISGLAIGLGTTLAARPDLVEAFTQPNAYPTIEKGRQAANNITGGRVVRSSSTQIATVTLTGGVMTTTGVKAGVASLAVSSSNGNMLFYQYQIVDSGLMTGYRIKNGAEVQFSGPGRSAASPVTTTPAGASGSIAWRSLQPGVAAVNAATGEITGVTKGVAIVIGEFTDKWGVERDLHILVGVGVNLDGGGSGDPDHPNLGDLMEWINKGEGILGIPPQDNPYTGDSLDDLRDAVNGGKDVVDMADPTEQDIRDAIDRIRDAIDSLEKKDDAHRDVIGPDDEGNYYLPLNKPKNVYQVVNRDGTSKEHPPGYVYNPRSPAQYPGDNRPARPGSGPVTGGAFWVEDPEGSNIWKKVRDDGSLQDTPAIWGGPGGAFGDGDDRVAELFGGDYWVHIRQNVWQKVDKSSPLQLDPELVGGGPDENPVSTPARPIYLHRDGNYYLGPIGPAGEQYYYGDRPAGQGGDGKLNSTPDALHPSDRKYWLVNGEMVTTPPIDPRGIKSISISPASPAVERGKTQAFTATITFNDNTTANGPVTWSLTGAAGGTGITSGGLLTVGQSQGLGNTLQVTAAATADTAKKATVSVNVTSGIPAGGRLEILDENGKVITDGITISSNRSSYQFGVRYYHPNGQVITTNSLFSWYTNACGQTPNPDEANFVGQNSNGKLTIWRKTAATRYITVTFLQQVNGEFPRETISLTIN